MSDTDDIKALDAAIAGGINAGDAGAVAACYTDDAALMPPGAPTMAGIDAVTAYWAGAIEAGLTDVTITPSSVDVQGESSITIGTVAGKMGDAALTGKYILTCRRTAAGWKVTRDIWNFDA